MWSRSESAGYLIGRIPSCTHGGHLRHLTNDHDMEGSLTINTSECGYPNYQWRDVQAATLRYHYRQGYVDR